MAENDRFPCAQGSEQSASWVTMPVPVELILGEEVGPLVLPLEGGDDAGGQVEHGSGDRVLRAHRRLPPAFVLPVLVILQPD